MRRKLLIAILALGTLGGFGSGIASLACHGGRYHQARREAFERHVADVCVDAARRARDGEAQGHPGPHPARAREWGPPPSDRY
ncbi:MAG: hypothetical protein IT378_01605 [Sandaracinaceae bacterium]|nr:hypothetical protein [Sandaracinaceae bacterium]